MLTDTSHMDLCEVLFLSDRPTLTTIVFNPLTAQANFQLTALSRFE